MSNCVLNIYLIGLMVLLLMRSRALMPEICNCSRPNRFTRHSIIKRVTEIAVNMDTIKPTAIATAKPRTGPLPNKNNKLMAMSEVMLESRMVP